MTISSFSSPSGARVRGLIASGLLFAAVGCGEASDDAADSHDFAQDTTLAAVAEADELPSTQNQVQAGVGADGQDWSTLCDDVYELRSHAGGTTPFTVRVGETHPQITIDPPWGTEFRQAVGYRPLTDNKKVLHHWILYAGMSFLIGWAPGDEARPPYPPDVGMDLPSTRNGLRLDFHYYNQGAGAKPEQDRSGVAVCTVKGARTRPKHAAVTMGFTSFGPILAPANKSNHQSTGTCTVRTTSPVHLLTAGPHAHKLATHMKFTVRKANGQQIVMHDEPFLFGEQGTYPLPGGEVIVETGDVVTTTCTFTNPTSRNVTFGESTDSEMCFNFATFWPKGALSCGGGLGGLGR
ncbi:MAG: hypothetical protein ABW252_14230 [Polyangiales bacterium]